MFIIESKNYKKDYKKKILDKHLSKENLCIQNIIELILSKENMQELINDVFKKIYHIEKRVVICAKSIQRGLIVN